MMQLSNSDAVIELWCSFRIVTQLVMQLSISDAIIEYWWSYRIVMQLLNSDAVIV